MKCGRETFGLDDKKKDEERRKKTKNFIASILSHLTNPLLVIVGIPSCHHLALLFTFCRVVSEHTPPTTLYFVFNIIIMSYSYLFKYIIIGDTGECAEEKVNLVLFIVVVQNNNDLQERTEQCLMRFLLLRSRHPTRVTPTCLEKNQSRMKEKY